MKVYRLKRYLFVTIALVTCFGVLRSVSAADEPRVIRVGAYQNSPKIFRDSSGTISGVFPDILDYIAHQEHWRLEYVFGTFAEGLQRLKNGEIDIMVDVAGSEERAAEYDLSTEPVLNSWGVVIVRKDSNIGAIPDLNGKRIAILSSSVYQSGPQSLDRYIHDFGFTAQFVPVEEYTDAFVLLDRGEVDASVVSHIIALSNLRDYPNLKQTDIFFSPTELLFALTKGAPDNQYLIGRLDYWVKQLRSGHDGFYQTVLERYRLTGFSAQVGGVPSWIRYALLGVAGLLLVSLVIVLWMKRVIRSLRQQAEEGSRQLSVVYENVSDPLYYISVEAPGKYRFTRVNPAFLRATGIPAARILGKLVTDVIPPASHDLVIGNYERAIRENTTVRWEEVSAYPTGKKYGEVSVTPFFDQHGQCTALIGTVHDVTESRVAEAKLREQDRVLREAERIGGFGSSVLDLKTLTTEASDSTYELFGLHDPGERTFKAMIECIDPAEHAKFAEFLMPNASTSFAVGTVIQRSGRIFRHDDGTPRWLFYTGRIEADEEGKPTKLVGTLQDITKQKELEQSKDEFISIASHQLRTPVSAINWVVEALRAEVPDAPPKARTYMEQLTASTNRLLRLTEDLLNYSNIEIESSMMRPKESTDSHMLFAGLIEELRATATKHTHALLLDDRNVRPVVIKTNRDALRSVFNNIITNAMDYAPAGEAITIALEPSGGFLKVSVANGGEQIPPDERSLLFERFYRGANAKKIKPEGSGMGLYIAKKIIGRLGGAIGYEPIRGGNMFWFTLPLQQVPPVG